MRTIRAKFHCRSVEKFGGGSEQAKLFAVAGGSPENESFAKASPSGEFTIVTDNPAAQGFLQAGKSYYLDVTSAEEADAAPKPAATEGVAGA